MNSKWIRLEAALLAGALAFPALRATTVEELNFLALHQRAAVLFHGRCVARREVFDKGPVPYTEYTFEVIEALKGLAEPEKAGGAGDEGKEPRRLTFRHAGTVHGYVRPDGVAVPPLRLGVPEYRPGDEMVLFLTKESRLGLCAPVGLGQGAFQVARKKGEPSVRNLLGNRRLFKNVPSSAFRELRAGALAVVKATTGAQQGGIGLSEFLELCRKAKDR